MESSAKRHGAFLLAVVLVFAIVSGCNDDAAGPGEIQITGTLVAHSACGGFDYATTLVTSLPTDQTGVAWEWDGKGTLKLRHLNGNFNCCPDISCEITLDGHLITVKEMEEGMCDCMCLTDVDYQITGLPFGPFYIKIIEIVTLEGDDPLEFPIFLTSVPAADTFAVYRDHYPWMPDQPSAGQVTEFSACGGFVPERTYGMIPDDSICVSWEYDENNHTLYLTHHNMVYNCGLYDVTAYIEVDTGGFWIDERAMINPVYCWCEFDIDMEIPNLARDLYGVALTCRVWYGDTWIPYMDTVLFMIDLTAEEPGYHCYTPIPIIN